MKFYCNLSLFSFLCGSEYDRHSLTKYPENEMLDSSLELTKSFWRNNITKQPQTIPTHSGGEDD